MEFSIHKFEKKRRDIYRIKRVHLCPSLRSALLLNQQASTFLPTHCCHGNGQLPVFGLLVNRARAGERFNEGTQRIRSLCVGRDMVVYVRVRFASVSFFLLFISIIVYFLYSQVSMMLSNNTKLKDIS